MQGANRSKVGHLARICNAADAVLGRKSGRNTKCNQPLARVYRHFAPRCQMRRVQSLRGGGLSAGAAVGNRTKSAFSGTKAAGGCL